jgi:hypothetical protein
LAKIADKIYRIKNGKIVAEEVPSETGLSADNVVNQPDTVLQAATASVKAI